jgi:hypothetical protein
MNRKLRVFKTLLLNILEAPSSVLVTDTIVYCHFLRLVLIKTPRSWEISVGIATGCGLDDRGIGFPVPVGARIFFTVSRPVLGPAQPPIHWVPWGLSPGVKRPGREADHSLQTSAEVKKTWIYASAPPILLHGVVLN